MSGSVIRNAVRRGFYLDSVALMRVSAAVTSRDGVEEASLMIGTPANVAILEQAGLLDATGRDATPADLVIAVRASDGSGAERALEVARAALESLPGAAGEGGDGWRPRSVAAGARALDGASLALVSVPGEHAAAEAHRALVLGLDVMIFSDNVPVADEVALKRRAHDLGRLVMGPDCGTAILAGRPIAFANAIPLGDVGVVSASGTGLQELSVLLARGGAGLSHGIGVGGRDLRAEVGGISTLDAIDMLASDPGTARIALVSKPPDEAVAGRVLQRLAAAGKPAVACFLGASSGASAGVEVVGTLHDAAEALLGRAIGSGFDPAVAAPERPGTLIRGLFSGGTLCAEAQTVALRAGLTVGSNAPVPGAARVAPEAHAGGHLLFDLGADEYTRGRPHPMLDPSVRTEPLAEALADPAIGVVLLDVVLGYGAHGDPAGAVAAVVAACGEGAPVVVASLCGVDDDPQDLAAQQRTLERAGIVVAPSNALAAAAACSIVGTSP